MYLSQQIYQLKYKTRCFIHHTDSTQTVRSNCSGKKFIESNALRFASFHTFEPSNQIEIIDLTFLDNAREIYDRYLTSNK
jgi:hypothetical protein